MSCETFVFCEGPDDEAVIKGIVSALSLNIAVEPFKGKDNLRSFLRAVRLRPEFAQQKVKSIAVIRDADEDPVAAFASVRDAFTSNGFAAPSGNQGIADGQPRCGILVIPPERSGMIEDLCLSSVSDQPEFPCVNDFFDCVAARSSRGPFTSKHKLHVWMGTHSYENFRKWVRAGTDLFPLHHAAFDPIRNFLRRL